MQVLLAARHSSDVESFASIHSGVPTFGTSCGQLKSLESASSVRLIACAFGPVHPKQPNWLADESALRMDMSLAEQVASSCRARLHAVLISSVVALAPTRDRCYYGGLKNLAECQIARALAACPQAQMSVLYPGRLATESRSLATTFAAVARQACALASQPVGASRIVGWDARLWLLRQSARAAISACTVYASHPPLDQRDGDARK